MRKILLLISLLLLVVSITQAQDDGIITYGETVTIPASVDDEEIRRMFIADAGDIIGINLQNSFDIARRLTVFNENGDIIIESTPSYSPNIDTQFFTIPESGDYTIVIEVSEITTEVEDIECYELLIYERITPTLENGVRILNNFTENVAEYDFIFEGIAGDIVSIYAESDTVDLKMVLFAPDGTEIASDDNSGGNLNPAIDAFTLTQGGTYKVIVPNLEQTQNSIYLTLIDYVEPDLHFGDAITLTVQPDDASIPLRIEGQAGDVISVLVDNPETALRIRILDGNGNELATNDSPRGMENRRLEQVRLNNVMIGEMATIWIDATNDTAETITLTLEQNLSREISGIGLDFHLSPEHPIQTFTINDPNFSYGGSLQGGEIFVYQPEYMPSMPFRITLIQDERVILSYEVNDLSNVRGYNSNVWFGGGSVRFGSIVTGQIELLGDSFAFFNLRGQWLLGIG